MSLSSSNQTEVQDWERVRFGCAVSGSKVTDVISRNRNRLRTVTDAAYSHVYCIE